MTVGGSSSSERWLVLDARTFLHSRVPGQKGFALLRDRQIHDRRKDQTANDGDVGHRKCIPGDKRLLFQNVIKVTHALQGFVATTKTPFGVLVKLHIRP